MPWNYYKAKNNQALVLIKKIIWETCWRLCLFLFSYTALYFMLYKYKIPSFPLMNFHHGQILLCHRQHPSAKLKPTPWGSFVCVNCLQFSDPLPPDVWYTLLDLGQGNGSITELTIIQKICPFLIFWSLWYSWSCCRRWYQIHCFLFCFVFNLK